MMFLILIPLIVFAIFESIGSLRSALIAAMVAALAESIFSYFYLGHLDSFSVASIFLVLLMGGLAYKKDSRIIFYLKPAILSFALGLFLMGGYFLDYHVLLDAMTKYSDMFSEEQQMLFAQEAMTNMLRIAGLTVGGSLIAHGVVTTFAAYKMSRWWWLAVAGLGGYAFMFVGIVLANVFSFL